jgi:hypothetical protein
MMCLLTTMLMIVSGCATSQRGAPVAGINIQANMDRTDYEVMGTTEGQSSTVSILGPVLRIIDGDKISVLGMKFFHDKYAYHTDGSLVGSLPLVGGLFSPVTASERAYYKALAATPEADAVAGKSMERSDFNILWFLFSKETVTYKGKALKYKTHP